MVIKNNILEDFARVSGSVAGVVFESAKNVQHGVKNRVQSYAKAADLVTRDEFEVVKKLAAKIKLENETLLKDSAEIKKQVQTIATSIDIMKEQLSKNKSGSDNGKTMDELKKICGQIDGKIMDFESKINAQEEIIHELSEKMSEKTAGTKTQTKKSTNPNNSLFGDE